MDERILHPGTRRESMLGHARALLGLLEIGFDIDPSYIEVARAWLARA